MCSLGVFLYQLALCFIICVPNMFCKQTAVFFKKGCVILLYLHNVSKRIFLQWLQKQRLFALIWGNQQQNKIKVNTVVCHFNYSQPMTQFRQTTKQHSDRHTLLFYKLSSFCWLFPQLCLSCWSYTREESFLEFTFEGITVKCSDFKKSTKSYQKYFIFYSNLLTNLLVSAKL